MTQVLLALFVRCLLLMDAGLLRMHQVPLTRHYGTMKPQAMLPRSAIAKRWWDCSVDSGLTAIARETMPAKNAGYKTNDQNLAAAILGNFNWKTMGLELRLESQMLLLYLELGHASEACCCCLCLLDGYSEEVCRSRGLWKKHRLIQQYWLVFLCSWEKAPTETWMGVQDDLVAPIKAMFQGGIRRPLIAGPQCMRIL